MDDAEILGQMPRVWTIAWNMKAKLPPEIELDDLIGVGTLGLVDAAAKYNPALGTPFGLYAAHRITGAIVDSLRELDWGSRAIRRKAREVAEATSSLARRLDHEPDKAEIAQALSMPLAHYQALRARLDALVTKVLDARWEDGSETIGWVVDPRPGPLDCAIIAETAAWFSRLLSRLTPWQREVLIGIYWLGMR